MSEIKLGCIAKDKITGFRGIVTGKSSYLYGHTQYLLSSKAEENVIGETPIPPTELWFTEARLEFVK